MGLDRAIVRAVRWSDVIPERYRSAFLTRLKDPNIYSMRSEIALVDVLIGKLLVEMGLPPGTPVEEASGIYEAMRDRLTFNEQQAWERILGAIELRMKLVQQDVKTLELMAQHSGRQAERAQALTTVVIEVMRQKLATTPEGRALLVELADDLESKVRELQVEERG